VKRSAGEQNRSKGRRISEEARGPTVRSLLKESDAGCIILAAAVLDHILERVHEAHVAANLTGVHPPNGFFSYHLRAFTVRSQPLPGRSISLTATG
jgi:hypothetical protein